MKRNIFIAILAICLSFTGVLADDDWSELSKSGNLWDDQKPITNDEFEKAIDVIQAKQKKKEARQKKRKVRKISGGGTSLHRGLDPMKEIQAQDPLKKEDDTGLLLNIPVHLFVEDKFIDTGFYNVFGEKDKNGEIYLSFYQSQFFKGKVKAKETVNDYEADEINFVKLIPYNDDYVQIVFGSLDFNAYVFVRYKNP